MIFLAEGRHIQVTGRHIIALFRCIASGSHQIIKVAARVWFRPSTPEALNLSLTRFQGWLPARVKWTKTKNSVNGKLYAPPFDADFVLGRCICARCARSVLWTSSQPSAIMPDGCPPCDTLLAMFGANAHQWERSAMAHLVRGTAVIWHCPSSVATQRHATSAASCGKMSVVSDQSLSLSMAQHIVHASNAIFSIWRHNTRLITMNPSNSSSLM